MRWRPIRNVSYVTARRDSFGMLEHRADDLVVPDPGREHGTRVLGGNRFFSAGSPPHEARPGFAGEP